MMSPAQYTIPAPLMQQVIHVLAQLPWGQINQLMSELQSVIQPQEQAQPQDKGQA